jgi:hypothetical protein
MAQDSFALPEQRPVYSQETAAPITPQAGLVGGNIGTGFELRDTSKDAPSVLDNFIALGLAVGDKKIKEFEAETKNRQFIAGMQRAAAGEAAKDIEAQKPWWSRMWGDGNEVAGARAWEGITDGNQMEASVLEKMPELRVMAPDTVGKALSDIHRSMMSGDPIRDAAQNAMWVKALPSVLKLHSKEHSAYLQEQAAEAQRSGIQSAFDAFEQRDRAYRAHSGLASPEDAKAAVDDMAMLMVPPPNANPVTYRAQIVEGLANSIASGNFAAFSAMNEAGLLDSLPSRHRRSLEALYDREARQVALSRAPEAVKTRLFNLDLSQPPEVVQAELDSINEAFITATGIKVPLVPTDKYQSLLATSARKQAAAAEKAEKLAAKEDADAAKMRRKEAELAASIEQQIQQQQAAEALVQEMVTSPRPDSIPLSRSINAGNPTLSLVKDMLPAALARQWAAPAIPPAVEQRIKALPPEQQMSATRAVLAQARAQVLQKEGADLTIVRTEIGEALKSRSYAVAADVIDALAVGAVDSKAGKLASQFNRLVPEEYRPMVAFYAEELQNAPVDPKTGDVDRATAFAAAEARFATSGKKPPLPKDVEAVRKEIQSRAGSFIGRAFGSGDPDLAGNTQAAMLTELVALKVYDKRIQGAGLTPQASAVEAAGEQIETLRGSGMAYLRNPQAPAPLANYLKNRPKADQAALDDINNPARVGKALAAAITEKGGDPATPLIFRADDNHRGEPAFVVAGQPGRAILVTLDDLLKHARKLGALPDDKPEPAITSVVAP